MRQSGIVTDPVTYAEIEAAQTIRGRQNREIAWDIYRSVGVVRTPADSDWEALALSVL